MDAIIWWEVWPQLALAYDALVQLIDALYLVLKFGLTFWQSPNNDVCSFRHAACKKQALTNLKFVLTHKPYRVALRACWQAAMG